MSLCPPTANDPGLLSLNASCYCAHIDSQVVSGQIRQLLPPDFDTSQLENLIAETTVFLAKSDFVQMQRQIAAIERVAGLDSYRRLAAQRTPFEWVPGLNTRGLFTGYDFHISADGPRLIEINTNAGGAFVVHALLTALGAEQNGSYPGLADPNQVMEWVVSSFRQEWSRATGGAKSLRRVAMVDDNPEGEFLYLDMQLAQQRLKEHGIEALIVDPRHLSLDGDQLYAAGQPIDLVYNRLTDFSLSQAGHEVLRQAHESGAAVVSPAPEHHALLADKRNLVTLTDTGALNALGVSAADIDALANIPNTVAVTPANAEALWARRRQLFFKPACGYGSKATYRGAKITQRVWREIETGDYVAQELSLPGERQVPTEKASVLKYDVRVFSYAAQPMLLAARLYRGQTTNFRTEEGGFAPVIVVDTAD